MHILTNISRSEGNKIMKFDQLIECNMINVFPEKPDAKCGGEAIPRPYSKKSNVSKSIV